MTIIATDGHTMVADSWGFMADVGYPLAYPKIVRTPDGGIVGAAGNTAYCCMLRRWAETGFADDAKPTFPPSAIENDDLDWLWLKPDGTALRGLPDLTCYPIKPPFTIGVQHACMMVEGAMLCGVDIVKAAQIAVERCNSVGGPLTVLALGG